MPPASTDEPERLRCTVTAPVLPVAGEASAEANAANPGLRDSPALISPKSSPRLLCSL